jgi:hypothetical protein
MCSKFIPAMTVGTRIAAQTATHRAITFYCALPGRQAPLGGEGQALRAAHRSLACAAHVIGDVAKVHRAVDWHQLGVRAEQSPPEPATPAAQPKPGVRLLAIDTRRLLS